MGQNASHEPLGSDFIRASGNLRPSQVRRSIRKSLRKRREKRKLRETGDRDSTKDPANGQVEGPTEAHSRKMDKLKRTLSLKKKKDAYVPDAQKPHVWQSDEASVRAGNCNFTVKYLGCVEVFESRGMQVCEEALKVLRTSKRRPIRGVLYVSGDGLRVVDEDTKGLIVDQTIEKVSFCAPDRNHERGFSYICRDGTARRWMCHGFVASKDSGERLSHAVGCAFAACLERKQKRDQDSGVTMTFDNNTSTFTRMGSFKQMTVTDRLSDPQECKPSENAVPVKKVENPHAIARPHATPQLLQRQGSFRVFNQLNQSSPFKRQLSLRLSDLPSELERARSMNTTENSNITNNNPQPPLGSISRSKTTHFSKIEEEEQECPRNQRNRLQSLPNTSMMAPIPESAPLTEPLPDAVSEMCQQVSAGLSLLSSFSNDPFAQPTVDPFEKTGSTSLPPMNKDIVNLLHEGIDWSTSSKPESSEPSSSANSSMSKGEEWLAQLRSGNLDLSNSKKDEAVVTARKNTPLSQMRSASMGAQPANSINECFAKTSNGTKQSVDPFDAEWASIAAQNTNPNNPFLESVTKTFEVKM